MPAKSKAQQKFMAMVVAAKEGAKGMSAKVKEVAKGIKLESARDFAKTSLKGLPGTVGTAALGAMAKRIKKPKVISAIK